MGVSVIKKYLLKLFILFLLVSAETIFAGLKPFEEIEAYSPTVAATTRLNTLREMTSKDFVRIIRQELNKIMSPKVQLTEEEQRSLGDEPPVRLEEWIRIINTRTEMPREDMLYTIIILKRLLHRNKKLRLTRNNAYRLFLIATILSNKMLEDVNHENIDWEEISCRWYSNKQLNLWEIEMFGALGCKVHIDERKFYKFIMTIDLPPLKKR